jgi:cellulose biosynthesis protein BcsQ
LIDVGPNFGSTNRAALICADGIVVPLAPDLFSLQGLRNLGPTLSEWREQWQTRAALNPIPNLSIPSGSLSPIGYVLMQFGIRDSRPVKAYERWSNQIPATYQNSVSQEEILSSGKSNCLAMLKHYRSLMPLAMEARKPVFDLKSSDGAIGAHLYSAQESYEDFKDLATAILERLEWLGGRSINSALGNAQ